MSLQEIDNGDSLDGTEENLLLQKVRAKCVIQLLLLSAIESLQVLDPLSFDHSAACEIIKLLMPLERLVMYERKWIVLQPTDSF